jgi:hypothetical protein
MSRAMNWGWALVALGLTVQIGASLFWSPAAFLLSAGLGLPGVLVGGGLVWAGTRGRGEAAVGPGDEARP